MATRTKKKAQGKPTPAELAALVNKAVGADAVVLGNDTALKVNRLETGFLPADILLQGGLPFGRFTIIVGDWSTLKSYIGLCAIASCQAHGGTAALIDTEHAYDPEWATQCGVNTDELIVWPPRDENGDSEPVAGEQAIDAAEALTRGGVDLIVFDSIAATLPQAEANKRLHKENIQPARLAALMSAAMRRLTAANKKTAYLWINQFRMNVGVTFGNPNVMTGGKAPAYYASYILEAKKVGRITRDRKVYDGTVWKTTKETVTQQFQLTVTKSKLSKPFRDVFFDWSLELGEIDMAKFLVAQGLENGVVKQQKASWSMGQLRATGRENFIESVRNTPWALWELERDARNAHGLSPMTTNKPPVSRPRPASSRKKAASTPRRKITKKTTTTKRTMKRR